MPKLVKILSSSCKLCGLYTLSENYLIGGRGNSVNPIVVMIGEAPGAVEDQVGLPFMGKAGKKLDAMIKPYDGTYYLTNVVRCLPPGINTTFRTPTPQEVDYCIHHLVEELHMFTSIPILVPLGNVAMTALIGANKGITKELGKVYTIKIGFKEYKVIPNYHPSYICRNPEFETQFKETIRRIYEGCTG